MGTIQLRKLIEDIFSLNLTNLPSIEILFKNMALKHITSEKVTNKEITRLFDTETSSSIEDIIKKLITMKPMIINCS